MRKINVVPNIITAFGLACGLFAIFKVNMVEPGSGTYQLLMASALLILLAAVADVLDGAIARFMHAESEFGFMFDSLSDAISFGVAPSVLLLKFLSLEQGTGLSLYAMCGAMLFSLCGVLRLVRFNVKTNEAKGNAAMAAAHKKHFTGLPIPAGALAAISAIVFFASPFQDQYFPMGLNTKAVVLTSVMIVLGYFMISRWKFPSVKMLHIKIPSFHLVLATVVVTLFLLYGILHFLPVIMLVATWSYVVLGWILSIIRLIAGKKSQTLADFEPEQEE
ncbi:MAG: CDP-alcohol phosphatidyltransferase family protein [Chlamydiae bacterium]|nr:CDP-alcohol phosphatidyltransferase family protein [Chlamydiota bacterium]